MKHELRPKRGGALATTWICSCGGWSMDVPKVGAYGHRSLRARMAQVRMGHHFHVKGTDPAYKARKAALRAEEQAARDAAASREVS